MGRLCSLNVVHFASFNVVCYEFDNGVWDVCVYV